MTNSEPSGDGPDDDDPWLTYREINDRYSVNVKTLRKWVQYDKVGSRIELAGPGGKPVRVLRVADVIARAKQTIPGWIPPSDEQVRQTAKATGAELVAVQRMYDLARELGESQHRAGTAEHARQFLEERLKELRHERNEAQRRVEEERHAAEAARLEVERLRQELARQAERTEQEQKFREQLMQLQTPQQETPPRRRLFGRRD